MSADFIHQRATVGGGEQLSTRVGFFVAGFGLAAWAPLVPFARARTGIGDGALGLLLLCLGVGSIVAMPLAGALAARLGCRRVVIAAAALLCLTLPVLAATSRMTLLAAGLFAFGAALGSLDVAINIQAIIVERLIGRSMMSGFHGLFSLGGIVGAASMTGLLDAGVSPLRAAICVVTAIVIAMIMTAAHLLPYGREGEGPTFSIPRGIVLFIGVLCFIAFSAEGAVLDWSAVFLASDRGAKTVYAGLGYVAFAVAMTICRFAGDRIVSKFGGSNVIIFGGICAAAGFSLTTLAPCWQLALLGYAMVGAGCSNIVPILYTNVGRQTTVPQHVAVSAITTFGYAGILAGPAAIGFVAHVSSLSAAFLILAGLQIGVAAGGHLLRG